MAYNAGEREPRLAPDDRPARPGLPGLRASPARPADPPNGPRDYIKSGPASNYPA